MVAFKHIFPVGALLLSVSWKVTGIPLPRDDLIPHVEITDETDSWHTLPNLKRNADLEAEVGEIHEEEENILLSRRSSSRKSSPLSDTSRDVPIALVDDKTSEALEKGKESKDDRENQNENKKQRKKKEKEEKEKQKKEKNKKPASDSGSDSGSADIPIALVDDKITETTLKTGEEAKHNRPNTRDIIREGTEVPSMVVRSVSVY